ncbi:3-ketoacyl-ACP reductase FabG2 [Neptunicella sp. SCSIO 80796]|uniref:3-ketoacyl-ACP reductase FabG2 n=1 Tax=Neptunicella plasticusilytica TaxID=3117012 RepID=UPI003A4E6314
MNRRVLVTGSSKGIGKAIALQLAHDGFDVTLHCRSDLAGAQQIQQQIAEFANCPDIVQFDLSDRQQVQQVLNQQVTDKGAYYGVVCNAGITRDNAFPAMPAEDWDLVMRTNLDGFYNVLQPLVMPMVQARQGGRIVSVASVSGILGNRGQVNYSASKAGLIGATKSLALELAKRKITVNCVAPGLIETDMIEELPVQEMVKHIPLRRMGQARDVAAMVGFLMSDAASYVTRQVMAVDGGLS